MNFSLAQSHQAPHLIVWNKLSTTHMLSVVHQTSGFHTKKKMLPLNANIIYKWKCVWLVHDVGKTYAIISESIQKT